MKAPVISAQVRRRRLLIRAALLTVYAGLIALVFVTGKGHTVLLDNKDSAAAEAIDGLLVAVNGGEELEMYRGDRDKATIRGQGFRVRVEVFADGTVVDRRLRVGLDQNMVLLSLPTLVAGGEPVLVPFTAAEAAPPPEEEVFTSEELAGELPPDALPDAETPPPSP